jgi:CDP-glycerol glycerophosphotransferase (TagB/SpsB family)
LTRKWIGVHTGGPHYLDHLGILCEGLGISLLVTQQDTYEAAKEFYPDLHVELIDLRELSLDYLAERADVIFESGHTFAAELLPLWELLHGKKMRIVYCPHGNSDKRSPKLKKDVSLIYGDYMREHLEKTGENLILEKMVVVGNYRAAYYRAHQKWYDQKLEEFLVLDPNKKTVLYAPTWDDKNWFEKTLKVVEEIEPHFNLLMRLHPFLKDLYPVESEKISDFSKFPSIYPILNRVDYYLGDFSSIGYDFLTCDKPLFFVEDGEGDIYDCGIKLERHDHYGEAIKGFQDTLYWKEKRKKLATRVFGSNKSFESIKNEIIEALSSDRASWITV